MILTLIIGIIVIVSEFIPHPPFGRLTQTFESWFLIIFGFAIILGQISLVQVNLNKISRREENWIYHLIGLISLFVMVVFGLLWGTLETGGLLGQGESIQAAIGTKPFDYLFDNVYIPLSATMFSLLAFFIASAAYRAFIIRSFESNLLMITAVIVIIGRTSFGSFLTGWLPERFSFFHIPLLTDYIMEFPNTAAQRAILISAALGVIGSSLRIILGIERSYLGSDK